MGSMKYLILTFTILSLSIRFFSQKTFILEYGKLNVEEAPFTIIESESNCFYSGIYKQSSGVISSHILKINNSGILIKERELLNKRLLGIKEIDAGNLFCYGINETDNSKPFFFLTLNEDLDIILNKNYGINDDTSEIDIYRGQFIQKNDTIHCFYTFSGRPAYVFSVNTNCDSLNSFEFDGIYDICENPDKKGYILTGHFSEFPGYIGETRVAFTNDNFEIYKVKDIDLELHSYGGNRIFIENSEKNIIFNGVDIAHQQKFQIGISTFNTTMTNVYTSIIGNSNYDNNIAFYDGLKIDDKFNIYTFSTINNQGGIPYLNKDNWLFLAKTDSLQNIIWEKYYGGDAFYQAYNFSLTNDGGVILAATKFDHEIDYYDNVIIFKVDSLGNSSIAVNVNDPKIKTHELILYPNPSKLNLNIRTAVQRIGGEFKMYDISGKQVFQQKITQSITQINTNNLPAGEYIYKYIHKNKEIESGKWIKE